MSNEAENIPPSRIVKKREAKTEKSAEQKLEMGCTQSKEILSKKKPLAEFGDAGESGMRPSIGISSAEKRKRASEESQIPKRSKPIENEAVDTSAIEITLTELSEIEDKSLSTREAISDSMLRLPDPKLALSRIVISEEESGMIGAPEGDLYDARVLTDQEISPDMSFDVDTLRSTIAKGGENLSWAHAFETVTQFRVMLVNSPTTAFTQSDEDSLSRFIVFAVDSLRSTMVKNGLYAAKQYLVRFNCNDDSAMHLVPLIQCVIKRCHSGAKFLCDIAHEIYFQLGSHIHLAVLISVCKDLNTNRNAEILKKSFALVYSSMISSPPSNESACVDDLIRYFASGLRSKVPEARSTSRSGMKFVKQSLGEEGFSSFIARLLPETECIFVCKELKDAAGNTSTNRAPPSSFGRAPLIARASLSCRVETIKMSSEVITVYEDRPVIEK